MKKAAIYARVSTGDQHIENQILDLRRLAAQRGFEVVREYCDKGVSGAKAKRPGLDAMMAEARRGEFEILLVAAFDRLGRNTKNFLELVDELNALGILFISAREAVDTSGPMGKLFLTIIGSIAELERSLIIERIKAGMRRAKLEGQRLGRAPFNIDRDALIRDRLSGMSLTETAKRHRVSRATVVRLVREASHNRATVAA
jgi:DNA invertase Pin-like site-specific DNA recombinase